MSTDAASLIAKWNQNEDPNGIKATSVEPNRVLSVVTVCAIIGVVPLYILGLFLADLAKKAKRKLRKRRSSINPASESFAGPEHPHDRWTPTAEKHSETRLLASKTISCVFRPEIEMSSVGCRRHNSAANLTTHYSYPTFDKSSVLVDNDNNDNDRFYLETKSPLQYAKFSKTKIQLKLSDVQINSMCIQEINVLSGQDCSKAPSVIDKDANIAEIIVSQNLPQNKSSIEKRKEPYDENVNICEQTIGNSEANEFDIPVNECEYSETTRTSDSFTAEDPYDESIIEEVEMSGTSKPDKENPSTTKQGSNSSRNNERATPEPTSSAGTTWIPVVPSSEFDQESMLLDTVVAAIPIIFRKLKNVFTQTFPPAPKDERLVPTSVSEVAQESVTEPEFTLILEQQPNFSVDVLDAATETPFSPVDNQTTLLGRTIASERSKFPEHISNPEFGTTSDNAERPSYANDNSGKPSILMGLPPPVTAAASEVFIQMPPIADSVLMLISTAGYSAPHSEDVPRNAEEEEDDSSPKIRSILKLSETQDIQRVSQNNENQSRPRLPGPGIHNSPEDSRGVQTSVLPFSQPKSEKKSASLSTHPSKDIIRKQMLDQLLRPSSPSQVSSPIQRIPEFQQKEGVLGRKKSENMTSGEQKIVRMDVPAHEGPGDDASSASAEVNAAYIQRTNMPARLQTFPQNEGIMQERDSDVQDNFRSRDTRTPLAMAFLENRRFGPGDENSTSGDDTPSSTTNRSEESISTGTTSSGGRESGGIAHTRNDEPL